jgi:hypothetical protein
LSPRLSLNFSHEELAVKENHMKIPNFSIILLLSVILLPHIAKTQMQPDLQGRATWLAEQFRNAPEEGINTKFGIFAAAARLKVNPDDAKTIDYITHYYDSVPPGVPGYWTSMAGVAWTLGKYWNNFTHEQREHLKNRLKGLSNIASHGTENHALCQSSAGYLFAQYWPNEQGWLNGQLTSKQLADSTRNNLMAVMRSLYDKGYNENLSTSYAAVHLFPYYVLFDCATDPLMKNAANAAIHFHVTNLAANHYEGIVIPPFNRENAPQRNTYTQGLPWVPTLQWNYWLYWGDVQNRIPVGSDFITNAENRYLVFAALSDWTPPTAINSLAQGQTVPYELTAAAANFGFWGSAGPSQCERYVYRDKCFAMGSGHFQYFPDEYYVDYNAFGIVFKSNDPFNYIDCYHPYWRSNTRLWRGVNSPFMQMAQHKGTAIILFNIPAADPWANRGRDDWKAMRDKHYQQLIQEALLRYPKSIDQKVEVNGWIFLREGGVYIAIRPLKPYTIDANYTNLITKKGNYEDHFTDAIREFQVVRSASPKTGFVIDIATKDEFASFEAFQKAVRRNKLTADMDKLSVSYTNLQGNILTSTWNTPNYDVPKETQMMVRPDILVDGREVTVDKDFINGKAVIKSTSVELVDRVLRVHSPAGKLVVDWRGEMPVFMP